MQISIPISPNGPLINVCVHLSLPHVNALLSANQPIPNFFIGTGLIDTGASGTMIDKTIVTQLGLKPTGTILIHTPSTGATPQPCNTYDVSLWFTSIPQNAIQPLPGIQVHPVHLTLPVTEADFSKQSLHVLIGRDILNKCHFTYDGRTQSMILDY